MSDTTQALTTTRHLPKPLNDARKREIAEELAQHINEKARLEEHLKQWTQESKGHIARHQKEIQALAQFVGQGFEMLPVVVREEPDFLHNAIKVIRTDLETVVEVRAMTGEERAHYLKTQQPSSQSAKEAHHG